MSCYPAATRRTSSTVARIRKDRCSRLQASQERNDGLQERNADLEQECRIMRESPGGLRSKFDTQKHGSQRVCLGLFKLFLGSVSSCLELFRVCGQKSGDAGHFCASSGICTAWTVSAVCSAASMVHTVTVFHGDLCAKRVFSRPSASA